MTPECWEPGCGGEAVAFEPWDGAEDWGYCATHLVDRNAIEGLDPLERRVP